MLGELLKQSSMVMMALEGLERILQVCHIVAFFPPLPLDFSSVSVVLPLLFFAHTYGLCGSQT